MTTFYGNTNTIGLVLAISESLSSKPAREVLTDALDQKVLAELNAAPKQITPDRVKSAYSGKNGKCCCGCAGKHYTQEQPAQLIRITKIVNSAAVKEDDGSCISTGGGQSNLHHLPERRGVSAQRTVSSSSL